ncbi:hypothetical protein B0H11DRAFT_2231245 [Mycena galericulata]|nr:hypothetical protein B0H11DRAFT_2231245 [Mycena galericulata]
MEDVPRWPPGPLLQVFDHEAPVIFSAPCTCTWPGPHLLSTEELEESVESVSVTPEGILFIHKDTKRPIFIKKFIFMSERGVIGRGSAGKQTLVTLETRPNVQDDLEIDIAFTSYQDCLQFRQVIHDLPTAAAELHTKIYGLRASSSLPTSTASSSSSGEETIATANLLKGFSALKNAINEVFTELAYSESAEILGQIVDLQPLPRIVEPRAKVVARVQQRFRTNTPPSILILTESSSDSGAPLPDHIYWKDEESVEFQPSVRPSPPSPSSLHVTNYGIHPCNPGSATPRYIALSHELVDCFAAAIAALGQPSIKEEDLTAARQSLEAATACVKTTIVHAIAHLWVLEQTSQGKIPEDLENPEQVEARRREPTRQGLLLGGQMRSVQAVRRPIGVKWPAVFMRR